MRVLFFLFLISSILYGNISHSSLVDESEDVVSVCVREAQKYIDFEMDYLDSCRELMSSNCDYQYNINDIIGIINKISEKKSLIQSVKNGGSSLDSVLYGLLKKRLFDVKCDDEERKYRCYEISDPERKKNKEEAKATFFQFNNLMIKSLFQSTTPDQLSLKTRRQIRLSPSLWPLLTGETEDLGHPDQTEEDLAAYDNYEHESEVVTLTHYGLGEKACFTKRHKVTPYERSQYDERCGKKIPELPYPDWLNPFKILKKDDPENNESSMGPKISDEVFFVSNSRNIIISNEEEKKQEDQSESHESHEQEFVITDLQQLDQLDTEKDFPKIKKESIQIEAHKKEKKNQEKSSPEKKIIKEILPPRGMRIFHSEQPQVTFQTQIDLGNLSGKHRRTLKSIFDSRSYATVSYGKFKSLWKAINGSNSVKEDTKSSHKVLLDGNGVKVSGIFSHGDGMCYTKRTIPYIRYALQLVGFDLY